MRVTFVLVSIGFRHVKFFIKQPVAAVFIRSPSGGITRNLKRPKSDRLLAVHATVQAFRKNTVIVNEGGQADAIFRGAGDA